ncbi:winged helix-turn-helix transcriptional regulator [Kitasatospora sp. NPDC048296]|uniref:winged helix-turn-helix transcriptional regulator n=1 Tax=Kitasatospora sp. NPDC048296 TaxID=3364048 RepID=UPI0037207915
MIMIGRRVIDREDLADKAGWNVNSLRNKGAFKQLDRVAGGQGAKELYDLEQAEVLARNFQKLKGKRKAPEPGTLETIPSLPDYSTYTEYELRGLIRSWLEAEADDGTIVDLEADELDSMTQQDLQDWVSGHELLTLTEARMAVPKDRRPTPKTWESYYARTKVTSLPDPDRTFYGVDFWFRATIERWNEERKERGYNAGFHRPAGSKSSSWTPRSEAMRKAVALSEERRTQVIALYEQNQDMTVAEIADAVGIHVRTAFRYLQEVAGPGSSDGEASTSLRDAVRELAEANPGISGAEVARRLGIGHSTANRHLNELGRQDARPEDKASERRAQAAKLLQENPDLTDEDLAEHLGVTPETAAAYRRDPNEPTGPTKRQEAQERLERTKKLLKKNPDLTADELAAVLGLTPITAGKYLREASAPQQP